MIKVHQNIPGKMSSSDVQQLLERLESLEHWSNQQDILLTGLMTSILAKLDTSLDTYTGTVEKST